MKAPLQSIHNAALKAKYLQAALFGGPEVSAKPSVRTPITSQWKKSGSIRSIAMNTGISVSVRTRVVKEHFVAKCSPEYVKQGLRRGVQSHAHTLLSPASPERNYGIEWTGEKAGMSRKKVKFLAHDTICRTKGLHLGVSLNRMNLL
ncbi:hypothetical protein CHISP_2673 [Chitinispirillum alkaliphilum]|nr:hypothetical protein CHISP_2673 [Chitinispirillum alkaliphilum]